MKLFYMFLICLVPSLAQAEVDIKSQGQSVFWEGDLWDYGVELGLGRNFSSDKSTWLLRARTGYTIVRQSIFLTAAPCIDLYHNKIATYGLYFEAMNFEKGVWFGVEPFVDKKLQYGTAVSVGYSLLGYEMNVKSAKNRDLHYVHFLKLKLPVSVFVWALNKK